MVVFKEKSCMNNLALRAHFTLRYIFNICLKAINNVWKTYVRRRRPSMADNMEIYGFFNITVDIKSWGSNRASKIPENHIFLQIIP
jgi:hypothetical protein